MTMTKGYVQLYTGNGKGKTTAALGLALRALGAGLRVCIIQFLKSGGSSEFDALNRFGERVTLAHFGKEGFVIGKPTVEDKALGKKGLDAARNALNTEQYDLVVLDEAAVAAASGVISLEDLLDLICGKAPGIELIVTGRNADPRLIDAADLVTDMREIKHYYTQGVQARKGIET